MVKAALTKSPQCAEGVTGGPPPRRGIPKEMGASASLGDFKTHGERLSLCLGGAWVNEVGRRRDGWL